MKLTKRSRYAVRALIDLNLHSHEGSLVRLQDISARQGISFFYLEQLFRRLRKGLVVKGVRGPGGGYTLSKPASCTSLLDIFTSVGEPLNISDDYLTKDFNRLIKDYLNTTTLANLI